MSAYLKRLNITDVDDTGENIGAYTKRVHIVEMVDADGQPWEPVPGPDPFDELVVVQETTWSESNVYAVGETISGTSATFTLVVLVMRPIVLVFSISLQQIVIGLTQHGLII